MFDKDVKFHKAPAEVLSCNCVHEFQDKTYGKDKRVHNPTKEGKYRCSVCRKERYK